jgi:glycogen debranching enzyme
MAEFLKIGQEYYIQAASAAAGQRVLRVLKEGDTFAVFDSSGDVLPVGLREQGIFHEGTRHLTRLELFIDGRRPHLLSSSVRKDNLLFTADLTNPDLSGAGRRLMERGCVHIFRSRLLLGGSCYERLRVRNYGQEPADFRIEVILDADFADLFEVRGLGREKRGSILDPVAGEREIVLSYTGLDDITRRTRVLFEQEAEEVTTDKAAFRIRLDPGGQEFLGLCLLFENAEAPRLPAFSCNRAHEQIMDKDVLGRGTRIETSGEKFNSFLDRSRADLAMLMTEVDGAPYPYAGIPWYSTPFGRDGIITALECLWLDPEPARGVLSYLAATQATEEDEAKDAEPGKILHEARKGEMANTGEVPFKRYYGSVDATPLFVLLAGKYLRRTGDILFTRQLWPHIEMALAWIDGLGDGDGDGLIEYRRRSRRGLRNQGWKDSEDAVFHADGSLAEGSIALCEVQAYVYGAKVMAATVAEALGLDEQAARLKAEALELALRFEERFWDQELGCFVLALDGDKRPCRVRTSNALQCALTGIVSPERARAMEDLLLTPEFHSGWGVRTLAADQPRYNPMSYHNGTIWPHDNALIAEGLARYGLKRGPLRILDDLFAVSQEVDHQRLPELYCGFHRRPGQGPTLYPVACAPQAWASGAPFLALKACLGLSVDAVSRTVGFHDPRLPEFLDQVTVKGLAVADAMVDFRVVRHREDVSVHLLRREGEVEVVICK